MIEKISINNIKNHSKTTITLNQVSALVGPNGAGKSTVLQAIYELNKLSHRIAKQGAWNWEPLNKLARIGQCEWSICISGEEPNWQIKVEKSSGTSPIPSSPKDTWVLDQLPLREEDTHNKETVAALFGKVIYFKGSVSQLSLPSSTLEVPPQISPEGNGLASLLADLMTSNRKKFQQIETSLCDIVPLVKEVNARTVSIKTKEKKIFSVNGSQVPYEEDRDVPGKELFFNTTSGEGISASAMSDGTLLILGLLATLFGSSDEVTLFLLDDIEQGLHPAAQIKLMQLLKNFAQTYGCQIIITSHSPYIIDALEAKDVWVMNTDTQGISRCKRLSEGPNAEWALKVLKTGEFLDAEGEDWVLAEPAKQEEVVGA